MNFEKSFFKPLIFFESHLITIMNKTQDDFDTDSYFSLDMNYLTTKL
jgi:hypothetical protein